MRVADYIFKTLADWGTKHVFLVTGGGAMHLNDALGREKRIKYICNLHEQACAMAAEGYARVTNKPAVVSVTTGPGGTNAITGVAGAWLDSIPMLVISGQVKRSTTIASCPELNLRQLGDQEFNIIDIVRPMTKYAVMINDKNEIRYHIEKAWHLAKSGRPGPVWLDIPLDIQAASIEESALRGYEKIACAPPAIDKDAKFVLEKIKAAKRPVIIAGNGVTLANACSDFSEMIEKLGIPVLTSISGIDLIPSDSPLFFGRPGILGERPANFIMQNSDLLLILGTRMNFRIIGYAYDKLAREAFKIMIDADKAELQKPTLKLDRAVHSDAGVFIKAVNKLMGSPLPEKNEWLEYCRKLKSSYPVVTDKHRNEENYVNSYVMAEELSKCLNGNEIIVTGNGTAYTSTYQAISLKTGNRMFANVACASMGYGLPAAIGAAFAGKNREVICLTGDGSLQMNLQELQTLKNYNLPVKLFVYNNDGYLSIKITQNTYFNKNFVGSNPDSGIILPDLKKLSDAYEIKNYRIENHAQLKELLPEILKQNGPVICELMMNPYEELGPKAASKKLPDGTMISKPLEDLSPFIDRDEFRKAMIIPPLEEN